MTRPLSSTPARLQGDCTTASLGLAVRERRHIFVSLAPMNMWLLCSAVVSCGGVSPSGMTAQWRLMDCTLTVRTEASVTSSHKRMKDPALVLPPRVTMSAVLIGRTSTQRYPSSVWSGGPAVPDEYPAAAAEGRKYMPARRAGTPFGGELSIVTMTVSPM